MFEGFSRETFDFLLGIRLNNNKEWFEERKKIYIEKVYEPLKALGELLYKPFEDTGMMYKVGRIYRDANFPPYLHYRDTMWICVRYEAMWWNKTPSLYFDLSAEGAEFGFAIPKPEAAVMERFRNSISSDSEKFLEIAEKIESKGITFGGDEYKRKKPCDVPEAERFFLKKGLTAFVKVSEPTELYSADLAERVIGVFREVQPLNDYFHEIVEEVETEKLLRKSAEKPAEQNEEAITVKAPDVEFMW